MEVFNNYHAAYDYAVEAAKALGLDHGIERTKHYDKEVFTVFLLPRPDKCFGHELRCERVTLLSPRVSRPTAQAVHNERLA